MTKLIILLFAVSCCGCIGVWSDSQSVAIAFTGDDKVCVNGTTYDVSDKGKSYIMRCSIKNAQELVFEYIGKASMKALWNVIDPVSHSSLSPAVCSIRLDSGYVIPAFFGPRCSYFVEDEEDDAVGMSVDANINPLKIDFSLLDSSPKANAYLELWCNLNMQRCDNVEKILTEFMKHGNGGHQVFLLCY